MHADVCPHAAQQLEQSGARRIHSDVDEEQRLLGGETTGNEEKGGGGKVGRHGERGAVQGLATLQRDGATLVGERHPEGAEHALGVSREGAASVTRVHPAAASPASSTADFTCALATGRL